MKKSILSLAVVSLSLLGLTACGGEKPFEADTIRVSGPAEHEEFILGQLNKLKTENEVFANITFEYSVIGEDKVDSVGDWSSAEAADVYAYASDKILPLIQAGAMAQVPSSFRTELSEQMSAAAMDVASLAGKTYAYPYAGDNGYFLYYDKSACTADDISSFEKLLAKAASSSLKVGYPLETPFYNMGTLFSFGSDYKVTIDDEGALTKVEGDFDEANGILAGKAMLKIMTNAAWQNGQAAPLAKNNLIACVNGGWEASNYKKAMGDKYACAKLPTITIDDKTVNMGSFLGYKLYGVNPQKTRETADKTNTHLALSHRIAKYLVSRDVQEARFDTLAIAPTNSEVKELQKVKDEPAVAAIAAQSEFAHGQGAVPAGLWNCTNNLVADIKAGKVTNENMATYMAAVNVALEKVAK